MHYLYRLTNKNKGKVYIGQAKNLKHRWAIHKKAVKNNEPTQIIHQALIKYGINGFDWDIIVMCKTLDDANELETELISQYESHVSTGKGYNVSLGGWNAPKPESFK